MIATRAGKGRRVRGLGGRDDEDDDDDATDGYVGKMCVRECVFSMCKTR